jgi:NADH-quinone oxidoreductase subunit M
MPDLSMREMWLLAPIAAAVLWMGIYPESFLAPMRSDIRALEARIASAAPVGDSKIKMGPAIPAAEAHHHEEVPAHGEAH